MKKLRLALAVLALAAFVAVGRAGDRLPGYIQAEKFTADKLGTMLFSTQVTPRWFPEGNKFWFTYKTSDGDFWYVVDPVARTRTPLFDRDDMASQLTEIVGDPFEGRHMPIRNLKIGKDNRTFTFEVTSTIDEEVNKDGENGKKDGKGKKEKKIFYFSHDYPTKKLTHLTDKEKDPKRLGWGSVSPDGKTVVYAKDLNLYKMSIEDYEKARKDENDSTIVDIQLTFDGEPDFGYGIPYSTLNTDTLCNGKRKAAYGAWSPDSKHFATVLDDQRDVKPLWVINSVAQPRPTLETYKYHMPGEKEAPQYHLYVFDMTNNTRKEVDASAFKDQTIDIETESPTHRQANDEYMKSVWTGDNNKFYLTRTSRDLHRVDVCSYTIGQDSVVPVIKERLNTYVDMQPVKLASDGKEIVYWSERDGWAHLYLYDDEGNLKNRITKGPWHVSRVLKVDSPARTVYFMANGMDEKENPYYEHLYRVNFDGSGLKLVTKGDYFHRAEIDDDCRFVVDNYSRVNTVPNAVLLDNQGNKVMDLHEADFSQLFAAGYKFPEVFKVKAADGVTDLWGTMFKPFDFDSTKVYPIIDYVYPGPQTESTTYPFSRMSVRNDRLAQAGFIVINVGQRGGHPSRSKWYHNYGYGNMRDYPLADHKYAIEQLAREYPFIDIERVGMHGHSGGGFMTAAAMFSYPDFFKAGVSCAGNHDNSIYNRWWSEKHHGVKEEVTEEGDTTFVYKIATNPEIARNLKGHLMLVTGEIDNNVHPANTIRVVNALIRAGKRFDLVMLPEQRHSFGSMDEYFYWRMVDFFSQHLLGEKETSVDIPKR